VVKGAWDKDIEGVDSGAVTIAKIERCKAALTAWGRKKFGNIGQKIRGLTKSLEMMQHREHPGNMEAIKQTQEEIH